MKQPLRNWPARIICWLALCCIASACTGFEAPAATFTPLPPTIALTPLPTATVTPAPGQQAITLSLPYAISSTLSQTETFHFLLYLPADYYQDVSRRWPLVLYLHGSGEAGNDLNLLKQNGLPEKLEQDKNFPFIVVSPQIPAPPERQDPTTSYDIEGYLNKWGWKGYVSKLEVLLDYIQASQRVDTRRVYLTGLSLGGFGVWAYALQFPDRFAAIVPIAGGYHFVDGVLPADLCDLKDLPIWVFHGQLDPTVDYRRSQVLVDGLQTCGAREVKFTLDPEGLHDVWSAAYADPALWEWLLAHEKNPVN